MMTGDRKETAEHVAQNIGLLRGGGASNAHLVVTSSQLALMTDDQVMVWNSVSKPPRPSLSRSPLFRSVFRRWQ